MINNVYAIYDEKAEAYNSPFPLATDGLARRAFENACKDPATDLYRYVGDYSLYHVGTWSDSDGVLSSVVPPRFICKNVAQNYTARELDKIEAEIEKDEVK